MVFLKKENLNTKNTFILGLILAIFLFLPLVSDAAVSVGIHPNNFKQNDNSPSVHVYANDGTENGGLLETNVRDSINIGGEFRAFAKTHGGTTPPHEWELQDGCPQGEVKWKAWSAERIHYKIDNGSWESIDTNPSFGGQEPTPTAQLDFCVNDNEIDPVIGSYSASVDTSGLPKDGSTHTLTIRGTSVFAGNYGYPEQEEAFIVYEFEMAKDDLFQCSNGIDDDGDGDIDYPADDGCDNANDDDETDPAFPDLEVSGASLANPPTATTGQTTVFDFVIDNVGSGFAPSASVTCRLNGAVFDSGSADALDPGETDWSWCQHNGITPAGNYTFQICVDEENDIEEESEGNNCDSLNFTVADQALPDLDVTAGPSVASGELETGENIKFKATFKNVGSASAGNSKVQFKVDGVSIYVGNLGGMNVNQSKQITTGNWNATAGTHTIQACADYQNVVNESNEANNCQSTQFTISDPAANSTVRVQATLDGVDWTGTVGYTVLGPGTINGTAVDTNHGGVEAGTWTITHNSGGPAGADFTGWQGNNTKTVSDGNWITFTMLFETEEEEGEPDLTTTTLSARNTATGQTGTQFVEGNELRFNATIHNQGDAATGGTSILRFTRSGISVSGHTIGSLNPGASPNIDSSPWTATEGDWTIQACADNNNDIAESNEGNNCRTIIINVESQTACNDGVDNDGDGLIDFPNDPQCTSSTGTTESAPPAQCDDGIDNDDDGWTDLDDPSCQNKNDNDESDGDGDTQCSDGIDNDGDGLIDGNDPHCSSPDDNTESPIQFEEF